MGFFDRIKATLNNAEPNRVHNVGVDDITPAKFDKRSDDWVK